MAAGADRGVAWSGIGAAVLFGTGNALWAFDVPDPGAPASEVMAFYRDKDWEVIVGANLSLLAIVLFVHFASGIRARIAATGQDTLAWTAFGGAILGVAVGLGAETINMVGAIRADADELSPELARSVFEISQILGFNAAGVGIGTFAIATAIASLRGGVLPRWLAWLVLLAGLTLVTPLSRLTFGPAVLLLVPVSVLLLRAPGRGVP